MRASVQPTCAIVWQAPSPERKTDRRWGVHKDGRSHESKNVGRGNVPKGPDGKFKHAEEAEKTNENGVPVAGPTLTSVVMPSPTEAINNPVMAAFLAGGATPAP